MQNKTTPQQLIISTMKETSLKKKNRKTMEKEEI